MKGKYLNISDGFYTISETDRKDQFYFWRNDLHKRRQKCLILSIL